MTGCWKKLSPEDVAEMKALAAEQWSKRALAKRYRIKEQTVAYHLARDLPRYLSPYAKALDFATHARQKGDCETAALQLRVAAKALLSV